MYVSVEEVAVAVAYSHDYWPCNLDASRLSSTGNTDESSIVAGKAIGSLFAICRKVRRKILPERVLGKRSVYCAQTH